MDGTTIGRVAAELMESLEAAAENYDGEMEIGEVMIVTEIRFETPDEDRGTYFTWRCSDERAWIQRAMVREADDSHSTVPHDLGPGDDDGA